MAIEPSLIQGNRHSDQRGQLFYFNEFDLTPIKRFYFIEHPETTIVRAWQGHKLEQKWFYVIAGSFKVVIVQPDNWEAPSENLPVREFILNVNNNQVLHIPGYFATGLQAMEPNSKMTIFSNFTVAESSKDDFRYDRNKWYNWLND